MTAFKSVEVSLLRAPIDDPSMPALPPGADLSWSRRVDDRLPSVVTSPASVGEAASTAVSHHPRMIGSPRYPPIGSPGTSMGSVLRRAGISTL
jgi:hypothetical protein